MSQLRAIIIDDNIQNLRVLVRFLARQDIICVEVVDPTKLHEIVTEYNRIDVAFVDLEMPGLDGYEVKNLLRSYFPSARIIAYTVHVSEINVVRDLGFDGFIGKPLDDSRFPDQLSRILNGEPVWERI